METRLDGIGACVEKIVFYSKWVHSLARNEGVNDLGNKDGKRKLRKYSRKLRRAVSRLQELRDKEGS
jgi:hypothetical protein